MKISFGDDDSQEERKKAVFVLMMFLSEGGGKCRHICMNLPRHQMYGRQADGLSSPTLSRSHTHSLIEAGR